MADHKPGDSIKANVRAFYDTVGWRQRNGAQFEDASRFEDLRPVAAEYCHRCHLRVARHLSPEGRLLLDVASGPLQFDEYLTYSGGYAYRVCADLSIVALRRARERLGDRGLFVVADITRLPFRAESFDGVVSISTIYHVPADEQLGAFMELHRVLRSGRQGVVVYSWGKHSRLMFLVDAVPSKLASMLRGLWSKATRATGAGGPGLYFFTHGPKWMQRLGTRIPLEVRVWRSISVPFMKHFVPDNALGRRILDWVYRFEERLPHFAGGWGQYPLLVIDKPRRARVAGEPPASRSRPATVEALVPTAQARLHQPSTFATTSGGVATGSG